MYKHYYSIWFTGSGRRLSEVLCYLKSKEMLRKDQKIIFDFSYAVHFFPILTDFYPSIMFFY